MDDRETRFENSLEETPLLAQRPRIVEKDLDRTPNR
jgi:hypothetical protein